MTRSIFLAAAAAVAVITPELASAQNGTGNAPQKNWNSQLGISTVAMPTYPGSNRYRARVFPIFALEFKERVYIGGSPSGTGAGTGLYVVRNSALSLTAGISGAPERKESHGDGLAGMGRRRGATFAASDVSYKLGFVQAGAGVQIGLGSDKGSTASFNLSTKKVYSQRWIAGLSTGATFANSDNMAYDFGVTPEQAARRQSLIDGGDSRLYADEGGAYTPKQGLKQAQVSTSLGYLITPRTSAMAFAMGSRLGSQAAASPLARQRNGVVAGLGLVFGI
jgi:outer membrane scaffolding protein for murein synthesis (MipA/OmpV family)